MYRSLFIRFLITGMFFLLSSNTVWAHSIEIIDPFEMSLGEFKSIDHDDKDPWKGTVSLTVTNTGIDPWGDFHFQIMNPDDGSVIFRNDQGFVPSMSGVTDYDYNIVNSGLELNFLFYGDPVYQNESVTFSFYTDNTSKMRSFFQVGMNATPVPLPGALFLIASGLIGIIGIGHRKK